MKDMIKYGKTGDGWLSGMIAGICLSGMIAGTSACNENEVFDKEQYKKVFALVSDDNYNIFQAVHDLEEIESTGYVAASCGGTNPIEEDLYVELAFDREAFDRYNTANFDVSAEKYAKVVPRSKYTVDDYSLTIPAGEKNGKMKIKLRPDGLSPDSIYFIPFKVVTYSAYELNPNKNNVLYQVLTKNFYATQKVQTDYTLRGFLSDGTTDGSSGELLFGQVMDTKRMHPVSRNRVRIMPGNQQFEDTNEDQLSRINRLAIILEIAGNGKVSIMPWRTAGGMEVTQIDGDPEYPNTFHIEDDGYRKFKTFLLRYNFKLGSVTYYMKEQLQLEFSDNGVAY
ncbi:MAG: DUF4361 domain-containing protein [Bacteroidales bacterium]|jgi:hypothetical protein|nr:DUF4361 domain-containing protein [Bacteroidales bacterium]